MNLSKITTKFSSTHPFFSGINTKIVQVAASKLNIPLHLIRVEYSDTVSGSNSRETAASITSENIGQAVWNCCSTLNKRLEPIRNSLDKNASWATIVNTAWERNVNLIANEQVVLGDLSDYVCHGLALSEVKVDLLTGVNQILRVDILEDVGISISPNIDIGQIEGACVMGLGYWLTEELIYDRSTGQLLTNRTWNYKPPNSMDIPIDFRVEMLQDSSNPRGFLNAKTTGEPATCLAVSVIFAIQQALQSARKDAGLKREWVRLGAPTTTEVIIQNSGATLEQFVLE